MLFIRNISVFSIFWQKAKKKKKKNKNKKK